MMSHHEEGAVDVAYLDVSKASDTVSHNTLTGKLRESWISERTVRWTENWLTHQKAVLPLGKTCTGWKIGKRGNL